MIVSPEVSACLGWALQPCSFSGTCIQALLQAGDPSFPSYPRVVRLQSRGRKKEHSSGGLGSMRLLAAPWRALCCGTDKAGSHPSLRSRTDSPLGSSLERSCLGVFPDRNCHQMPLSSDPTQMIPGFPIIQSPSPSVFGDRIFNPI